MAPRTLLPSFLYAPGDLDFPKGSLALPWDDQPQFVTGELARRRGAENPVRLIASAKSWLSHGGANRTSAILPWGAPDEVPHISPVDASAQYLKHLAAVFDREVAHGESSLALAQQDVLLTVPASFDEEARELTLRAARTAGLEHVTLLEEPQAAFYAWLDALGDGWRRRVKVGDLVLVCDVGGGTTDFSLIAVGERDGELTLEPVAVGSTSCSGATTWTSPSRACSSSGSNRRGIASTRGSCTVSGTRHDLEKKACWETRLWRIIRSPCSVAARD